MKAEEQSLHLVMSRRMVNLLTSMMPQMEGLFLATVTDGKLGHVTLRFDASVVTDIRAMIDTLQKDNPDEVILREPSSPAT